MICLGFFVDKIKRNDKNGNKKKVRSFYDEISDMWIFMIGGEILLTIIKNNVYFAFFVDKIKRNVKSGNKIKDWLFNEDFNDVWIIALGEKNHKSVFILLVIKKVFPIFRWKSHKWRHIL